MRRSEIETQFSTEVVTETEANQQAVAGEASSSRRKRQRLPSIVQGGGGNGGGTASGDQNIAGDEEMTVVRSGTLLDLDLLDCPVCCNALTIPIFQCDNGHIACSFCCTKLRNKCPACALPIGNYRCRIMERVVEATVIPCLNAKRGCTEKFSYGKELDHEKECGFALCSCPAQNCNYSGVYKDLYSHYDANHRGSSNRFWCGHSQCACVSVSGGILVLQEYRDGPLVVVQSFKEPQGVYVTANCIAPSAPGVGKFSYKLSYSRGCKTMKFEPGEMNRIQKVSFHTPEKDFIIVKNERTLLKSSENVPAGNISLTALPH
ncbi:unnamed protein product [Thlaspi arvense]|uniref:RING-type E3 ubiquitin transferase n=1 Tax=Thlaspi arvense TaxID=13288 RepID=A0AAU9SLG3_THLAR|nr:unnamed protein product [Thlaspi arvense]